MQYKRQIGKKGVLNYTNRELGLAYVLMRGNTETDTHIYIYI